MQMKGVANAGISQINFAIECRNSGYFVAGLDRMPAGYVVIPGGLAKHRSCGYTVPNGSQIDGNLDVIVAGKVVGHIPDCNYPTFKITAPQATPSFGSNGYDEAGRYRLTEGNPYNAQWVDRFTANWTVPALPPHAGQQMFYWIGLQDATPIEVLQPVLQYYDSDGYWTIKAWWVAYDSNSYAATAAVRVQPGDSLTGRLDTSRWYPPGPGCATDGRCTWGISLMDNTSGAGVGITVLSQNPSYHYNQPMVFAASGVLEYYYVTACSSLPGGSPGSLAFSNLALYVPYPNNNYFQLMTFNQTGTTEPYWTSSTDPNPLSPSCSWGVDTYPTQTIIHW